MAENAENIESKLCAYVDGELSPAESAEIERHLEANPSHGALVQELIGQRRKLQRLPREPAPHDLIESLQAQLEREVLLSDPRFGEGERFRINRWPQVLSFAAIVTLTAGLGAIVYSILPSNPPIIALTPTPQTPASQGELAPEFLFEKSLAKTDPVGGREMEKADSGAGAGAGSGPPAPINLDAPFNAPAAVVPLVANGDNTVVITVLASNLEDANRDVLAYLTSNGIAWSSPDLALTRDLLARRQTSARIEPITDGHGDSSLKSTSRAREQDQKLKMGLSDISGDEASRSKLDRTLGKSAATPSSGERAVLAEETGAAPGDADAAADVPARAGDEELTAPRQPQAPPAGASHPAERGHRQEPIGRDAARFSGRSSETEPASNTTPQPAVAEGRAMEGEPASQAAPVQEHKSMREAQVPPSLPQDQSFADATGSGHVIVVRNITNHQVNELAGALSQPGQNRWASVNGQIAAPGTIEGLAGSTGTKRVERAMLREMKDELTRSAIPDNTLNGVTTQPATRPAHIVSIDSTLSMDPPQRPRGSNIIPDKKAEDPGIKNEASFAIPQDADETEILNQIQRPIPPLHALSGGEFNERTVTAVIVLQPAPSAVSAPPSTLPASADTLVDEPTEAR